MQEYRQTKSKSDQIMIKQRCMHHIGRRERFMARHRNYLNCRTNILELKDNLEDADNNLILHDSLKQGSDAVDKIMNTVTVERVEELMDNIAEQNAGVNEITFTLSSPVNDEGQDYENVDLQGEEVLFRELDRVMRNEAVKVEEDKYENFHTNEPLPDVPKDIPQKMQKKKLLTAT